MTDQTGKHGLFRVHSIPCPFENLVALHVRCLSNQIGGKLPLALTLEVEGHHLSIPIKKGLYTSALRAFVRKR